MKRLTNISLVKAIITCVVVTIFFKISELVLATNFGIADKDEGLYLLAADPPDISATWYFPWGWHTRFIFELANFNLSTFRAVGATILILVSMLFVNEVLKYHFKTANNSEKSKKIYFLGTLIIGLSFGVIFYASFIYRTPGYNWVNYVGTLLACAGLIKRLNIESEDISKNRQVSAVAIFAAGLFIATPAKPSTPMFLFLISIVILILDKRSIKNWIRLSISFYGVFILLALALRIWPLNFLSILLRAFNSPVVDNDQSVIGALLNIFKIPSYVSGNIRSNNLVVNISLLLLIALLIFLMKKNVMNTLYYLYPLILVCIFMASGISFQAMRVIQTDNLTLSVWKLSTALLILLAINLVILWILYRKDEINVAIIDRKVFFTVSLCIVIPFLLSFGSAHGILNMGSLFSAPLLLAAVLLSFLIADQKIKRFLVTSNFAFIIFLVLTMSIQSYQNPWNISPPSQPSESMSYGKHGDEILVDKALSMEVQKLRGKLLESGWVKNQSLLGVNWHIASTVPYLLGARPPNSLMLTIYGYDNSLAVLNYNLSDRFDPYPYDEAWIMATPEDQLSATAKIEMQKTVDILEAKTFRKFPEDYTFVTQSMNLEFWKPSRKD